MTPEEQRTSNVRQLRQLLNLMKQRYHAITRQLTNHSDAEGQMLQAGISGWWAELTELENVIERLEAGQ